MGALSLSSTGSIDASTQESGYIVGLRGLRVEQHRRTT
jgi:hypothetical protein